MESDSGYRENSEVSQRSKTNERLVNYFRHAAKTTVKKYISSCTFRVFSECHSVLVRHNRKQLKVWHKELIDQLGKSIAGDLEILFKEDRVFEALRKLDAAISKQTDRTEGWIPSGNPEEDLRDHLHLVKLKHKQRLLKICEETKAENDELLQELSENHKAIMDTKNQIQKMNSEMNGYFNELKHACRNPVEPQIVP